MRQLVLLRGPMGSGKDTFIRENKLEQYTLSADEIRLLFQSPRMNKNGDYFIDPREDSKVWRLLFELLEHRMQRGEFTIVNATHIKRRNINSYRELAKKYRYRVTVVDVAHDVTEEELLYRNRTRDEYKRLDEDVVMQAYTYYKMNDIPSFAKLIKKEEFAEYMQYQPLDYNQYKKIHHIGDIHGSFTVLQEYLKDGLKDDELYIFVGDYIDRGIENVEVLKYLIEIKDKKNVLLLEGNHEAHLRNYLNKQPIHSKDFKNKTLVEIEKALKEKIFSIQDLKSFTNKLAQLAYYTYREKTVLVTHGGVAKLPENLMFLSTEQLIKGVDGYSIDIDKHWTDNMKSNPNVYQVHGHRNSFKLPIENGTSFNLEGSVERSGHLRVVVLEDGGFTPIEVKNNVFDKKYAEQEKFKENMKNNFKDIAEFVAALKESEYIKVTNLKHHVSSFNFTRKAFNNRIWNTLTTQARGLFINTKENKIVARSYDKFFNLNERPETKITELSHTLSYPLVAYEKPNGYLGILSIKNDEFYFVSKSTDDSNHAKWFKELFETYYTAKQKEALKNELLKGYTAVFEVILPEEDPHIIKYEQNELILLDFIKNEIEYKALPYKDLLKISEAYEIRIKKQVHVFEEWIEFYRWYTEQENDTNTQIEGYVFVAADDFKFKYKSYYYQKWKTLRSSVEHYLKNGQNAKYMNSQHNSIFKDYDYVRFLNWLYKKDIIEIQDKNIIELREEYEKETKHNEK